MSLSSTATTDPTLQRYQTLSSAEAFAQHGTQTHRFTPMMQQFLEAKQAYPDTLLFYRMGDFYETFLEDALIAAKALEITLTGRDAGILGKIPMAGVPVRSVDHYLTRLLAQHHKIAICEQLEDPALAKGLVKRAVVRVLTAGTVVDAQHLQPDQANYLASITQPTQAGLFGLAYCDLATGTFQTTTLGLTDLTAELARLAPSEVLVVGQKIASPIAGLPAKFTPNLPTDLTATPFNWTPLPKEAFNTSVTESLLKQLLNVKSLEGYGLGEEPLCHSACGAIAHYLRYSFLDQIPQLDGIKLVRMTHTVAMTASARKNLELLEPAKTGDKQGSLLGILNHTVTPMGSRLLRDWIGLPLRHLPEIESRLETVETLVNRPDVRTDIRHALASVYDVERLVTKLANLTATPRDFSALRQSLEQLPALSHAVQSCDAFYLLRLQGFPPEVGQVVQLLGQAILPEPAIGLKEGGIFNAGYDAELDRLRAFQTNQADWLSAYEQQERDATGLKNLKVNYNGAFGFFIELPKVQALQAPAHYTRKQTLTNAERFTTPELKAYETDTLQAEGKRFELEYTLFVALRQTLLPFVPTLKEIAHRLACADALQSLATVANQQGYVRPKFTNDGTIRLTNARHPVVEKRLPSGRFVANSTYLQTGMTPSAVMPQVQIVTGPNMAGKSTYMRQVALVVLMAQMGSFVPADEAIISPIDALYTRIGATDDLASGQSTFMVEMVEVAHILNTATANSLVLLDEVGRGTSTYDGVAIAWSVLEYLVQAVGCKTVFATHYHELTVLEGVYPQAVQNVRVVVSETQVGGVAFLHRVEAGAAQKSYGVQVAKMAGLPAVVCQQAEQQLNEMNKVANQQLRTRGVSLIGGRAVDVGHQLQLFGDEG
jgi:DNA mismatch repair protein MutS